VFLKYWGWNSSFAFLCIMGLITFFMVYKYVPETNTRISLPDHELQDEKSLKDQLKMIISNRDFINSTMVGSIAFASLIIYISMLRSYLWNFTDFPVGPSALSLHSIHWH
jgi:DHA1 family bicyclomycin/chloramphenicol resistance-like MFS transporter